MSPTLEQLVSRLRSQPAQADSPLAQKCLRLMRVPLNELTTENVRMLILQQIGLEHLVPLAMDTLEVNPFAAGDHYAGDLLHAVVRAPPDFWASEPELRSRLDGIIRSLQDMVKFLERDIIPAYQRIYGPY
jgi:CDI immunity proteins